MASPDPAALDSLPWRGPGPDRPALAVPPGRLPMFLGRRMRKRWRYVSAFCNELMVCAARVEVGPAGQSFWAILDRSSGELLGRTRSRPPGARGEVWTETVAKCPWTIGSEEHGPVTFVDSGDTRIKLRVGRGTWAESICPTPEGAYVWTRKRVAAVECDVRLADGRRWNVTARGVEDESAGYHPRRTTWSWSAGVGEARDGTPVGWNLVEGVNDPPERSERAIWAGEETREPAPVRFEGLDAIAFAGGSRLEFAAEAERRDERNLLAVRYTYRQPFGTFSGSLDGIELATGIGVMESHDAIW